MVLSKLRNQPKPGSRSKVLAGRTVLPAARTELYLEYPALEVKLDPFRVHGMKKPIQVSFVIYADKYSWGDYKGQGIYVMERP